MKRKRMLAFVLAAAMVGGLVTGCGSSDDSGGGSSSGGGSTYAGKVYYLNFKPEQADQWVELAEQYTE